MSQPVPTSGAAQPSSTGAPVLQSAGILGASRVESPARIDTGTSQPQWNSNSYYAPHENNEASNSPTRAASGSKNPAELLRRLSLVDGDRPSKPDVDPRVAYPALNLSGRIISATFCIPHSLGFRSGHEWVRRQKSIHVPLCL